MTITPTAPPESTAQAANSRRRGGLLSNTGKAAGLFVGVVLILFIIALLIIRGILARRRRKAEAIAIASHTTGDNTPQRRPSRLSQMGLVSGNQRPSGGRVVPGIQTSGWGPGNGAERSPTDTTPLDRTSYPRVVDQRLDPVALWNPLHDNGSHISVRSFRDDQDYSRRMLRVSSSG